MYIERIGDVTKQNAIAAPRSPHENVYLLGLILESMRREQQAYTELVFPMTDACIYILEACINATSDILDLDSY